MATLHKDFQKGTTTVALDSVATAVTSAGFTSLPSVSAPDVVYLTLDPEGVAGAPEVVKVTAHTGGANAVTVQRGQLGSTARSHAQGVVWVHGVYAAELDQLRTDVDAKLPLSGGTLTGAVVLAGAPTQDLQASTKKYVDDADALLAPKASPTFTGTVTVPTPTAAGAAATKGYVDGIQSYPHKSCFVQLTAFGGDINPQQDYALSGVDLSDPFNMHSTGIITIPDAGLWEINVQAHHRWTPGGPDHINAVNLKLSFNGETPPTDPTTGPGKIVSDQIRPVNNGDIYTSRLHYGPGSLTAGTTVRVYFYHYAMLGAGDRCRPYGGHLSVVRVG